MKIKNVINHYVCNVYNGRVWMEYLLVLYYFEVGVKIRILGELGSVESPQSNSV